MKKVKENLIPLCLLITLPLLNSLYEVFNNANNGVYYLVTKLDNMIPFYPIFMIPYMCWYPFMLLTMIYFCFKDKKIFYKLLLTIDLGLIVCYVFYFFFQTTVPRPAILGDGFVNNFVRYIYKMDNPYNCFPSIHIMTCYLLMKGIWKSKTRNKLNLAVIWFMGNLIILATLFTKQHIIADLVSAVLLGNIIYDLLTLVNEEKIIARFSRSKQGKCNECGRE